ncbi:MAG: Tll0287-like domain-containing protein [Candidatus Zhuqueibacterota bacterium]
MKKRSLILSIMLVCGAVILGCSQQSQKLTAAQESKIREIGESSALELMKNLRKHLVEAMNQGGAVEAIEVCASQAIPITEEVQSLLQKPIQLKRTSFKFRNPFNAPDSLEALALKYFEASLQQNKTLPEYYIQPVFAAQEYRYYKPMTMDKPCLSCHASPQTMDPKIAQILSENYPNDKAVDYQLNDFRGLVRVSIKSELIN